MVDVAGNVRIVQERVAEAAASVGRRPEDVTILGATKKVPVDRINEALAAGLRVIGENYVQEAQKKIPHLHGLASVHFIGHLQTNKAKYAVRLFDTIECVDSERLARELDKRAAGVGKVLDVLLEVNIGDQATKAGVPPAELLELVEKVAPLEHLRIRGLMAMPPFTEDPEDSRPYFRELFALARKVNEAAPPGVSLEELSMGMSHDYPIAVQEGATIVRVGTALFGPRPPT